jgi:hypothetical protein
MAAWVLGQILDRETLPAIRDGHRSSDGVGRSANARARRAADSGAGLRALALALALALAPSFTIAP